MLPLQPYLRLNELLNAADIHLLPQRAGAADLVMPSKLTGMLSSGRPVLATAEPDTQVGHVVGGYMQDDACGVIVPTEDPTALHAAVKQLVNDPELRQRLGTNARRYAVEHLGREQVLERFQRDLSELL
jgi:colanic acid biosynthesis glycosyl transferase WcaI